jgi:hypothetical protein
MEVDKKPGVGSKQLQRTGRNILIDEIVSEDDDTNIDKGFLLSVRKCRLLLVHQAGR